MIDENKTFYGIDMAKPGGDMTAISIISKRKLGWTSIDIPECDLHILDDIELTKKQLCAAFGIPEDIIKPLVIASFIQNKDGSFSLIEDIDYEIIEPKQLPDANNRL